MAPVFGLIAVRAGHYGKDCVFAVCQVAAVHRGGADSGF